MKIEDIPIALIDPPTDAHRLAMDEQKLHQLADSIRDVGLVQPITLRRKGDRYEIIAGDRRYCAHKILRLETIEAVVREPEADDAMEAIRFAENLQRVDLTPIEEAVAMIRHAERTGATTKDLARDLNHSESWVDSRLALLRAPADLQDLVHAGTLAMTSALILARVTDEQHRKYLTTYANRSGASAAVLREWVSLWELSKQQDPNAPAPAPTMDHVGGPVTIQMPCFFCGGAHDHTTLTILRACMPCVKEFNK